MNQPKDAIIRIDVPGTSKHTERTEQADINILCLDLKPFSFITQFMFCLIFVFIFYLAYGYYLELLFANSEVSFYITLVQFLITTALSYVESLIRSPIKRKVPLKTYALLAGLTLGTMAFSNLALSYLNYPTQLIFKSCKLIPVMIGSIIILGKRYGFLDYVSAVVMCIGLTMFTLEPADNVLEYLLPEFDRVFGLTSSTDTGPHLYVWSGMLVILAIYLNHYSKKNPNYVPSIVVRCWQYMNGIYQSEYRYLRIKSKMYADTV
ncbi:hypothetical protein HF086_000914 [Spodoptera exigua]|uniref:Adenosine 3'-phospho 5'-phosphosulfate transporter 2 n=1 Tax=Spodoptera exigua TaxID=7107 RepID=A0A922SJ58_SPOEX|nr:hypothetical protein HF086_000914 [Spodoptera exigua]